MKDVTQEYWAAVYADARWSNILVRFQLVDVTAAEDATPAATNEARLSNLPQTHDNVEAMGTKIATLERDYWALDGTFELAPADASALQTGWWSGVLSDEAGVFSAPPALRFAFAQTHTSVGFTVHFDQAAGEWCSDFTIAAFDAAGTRVSYDQVRGNDGPVYVSDISAVGYCRVEVTFLKTATPYRRVRVSEVVFGVVQTFTGDNTERVSLLYELSPRMGELPMGELSVTIDNRSRRYNLISPSGIYRFLQEGQPLDTYLGVGQTRQTLQQVHMGRHYYYRSSAADSGMTAEIVARDQLSFLEKGSYRRGRSGQDTLEHIIEDILTDSGAKLQASIPVEIGSVTLAWCLPVCSHREALRLAAQAARAVCYVGRNDTLCFTRLGLGAVVDTLDLNNLEQVPDIEVSDPVNTVEVSVYSLQDSSEETKTATLYEGSATVSGALELWVVYSGPARNVTATVTGGTLVAAEYFLHAAKLTLSGSGEVKAVVTGVQQRQSESVYTLRRVGPGETEQSVKLVNPLIATTDQARTLAEWRLSVEGRRLTYPLKARGNPARELGDTACIFDAYGENRNAVMTRQEFTFDGTLSERATAWGGGISWPT